MALSRKYWGFNLYSQCRYLLNYLRALVGQVGVDPTIPVKEENLQSSAFADSLLTHMELLAKFELAIKNALPTKL